MSSVETRPALIAMPLLHSINFKRWLLVFLPVAVAATAVVFWGVDDDGRAPTTAGFICESLFLLTIPVQFPAVLTLGALNLIGLNSFVSEPISAFLYFVVCLAVCYCYLIAFKWTRRRWEWVKQNRVY